MSSAEVWEETTRIYLHAFFNLNNLKRSKVSLMFNIVINTGLFIQHWLSGHMSHIASQIPKGKTRVSIDSGSDICWFAVIIFSCIAICVYLFTWIIYD